MLVYTAQVAQMVRHVGRFGIGAEWGGADWPAIRDRVTRASTAVPAGPP
jgi:hypothetical protein